MRFSGKLNGDLQKMSLNLALFQWLHFFLRCKEALFDHDWAMSHFTENDMVINAQPTGNSCENAAPRAHGYTLCVHGLVL